MSRGSLPSTIRKKPIACSNALGPTPLTLISSRLSRRPFSSRCATIFLAVPAFKPATYFNNEGDAVLILTPTWLTAVETTKSRLSANLL